MRVRVAVWWSGKGKGPGGVLLSHGRARTIIGAGSFHVRVRDGIEWFRPAMAARRKRMRPWFWRRRRHRYSSERGKTLGCYALKPHGRLVPVSCTHCCAFTSGLLTWWSSTALQEPVARVRGDEVWEGASRLDAFSGYPFRAWLPGAATGVTTGTPEARPLRSSRTGSGSPHVSKRLRQIGSELSHDVLNPTHVPL